MSTHTPAADPALALNDPRATGSTGAVGSRRAKRAKPNVARRASLASHVSLERWGRAAPFIRGGVITLGALFLVTAMGLRARTISLGSTDRNLENVRRLPAAEPVKATASADCVPASPNLEQACTERPNR